MRHGAGERNHKDIPQQPGLLRYTEDQAGARRQGCIEETYRQCDEKYGLVSKYTQWQFKRQPLDGIAILHTDRGSEFKNECIDRIIKAFGIRRSLSRKGCPYDNAVAEATYSIFKAEFVAGSSFSSLKELERALNDYVLWYNNVRIHGSLGYLSPVAYRQSQNPPVR